MKTKEIERFSRILMKIKVVRDSAGKSVSWEIGFGQHGI